MRKCGVTASCRGNKDGVRDEKVIKVSAAFSRVGKKRPENMKSEQKKAAPSPTPAKQRLQKLIAGLDLFQQLGQA